MGLLDRILYGVDLDEEQRRQDELDRQLAELNREDLERGFYDAETYAQAEANRIESYIPDVEAEVDEAFGSGLEDGFNNVTGAIRTTLDAPRRFLFASLPWYFWVLGALALVWWLNPGFLRRFIRR